MAHIPRITITQHVDAPRVSGGRVSGGAESAGVQLQEEGGGRARDLRSQPRVNPAPRVSSEPINRYIDTTEIEKREKQGRDELSFIRSLQRALWDSLKGEPSEAYASRLEETPYALPGFENNINRRVNEPEKDVLGDIHAMFQGFSLLKHDPDERTSSNLSSLVNLTVQTFRYNRNEAEKGEGVNLLQTLQMAKTAMHRIPAEYTDAHTACVESLARGNQGLARGIDVFLKKDGVWPTAKEEIESVTAALMSLNGSNNLSQSARKSIVDGLHYVTRSRMLLGEDAKSLDKVYKEHFTHLRNIVQKGNAGVSMQVAIAIFDLLKLHRKTLSDSSLHDSIKVLREVSTEDETGGFSVTDADKALLLSDSFLAERYSSCSKKQIEEAIEDMKRFQKKEEGHRLKLRDSMLSNPLYKNLTEEEKVSVISRNLPPLEEEKNLGIKGPLLYSLEKLAGQNISSEDVRATVRGLLNKTGESYLTERELRYHTNAQNAIELQDVWWAGSGMDHSLA